MSDEEDTPETYHLPPIPKLLVDVYEIPNSWVSLCADWLLSIIIYSLRETLLSRCMRIQFFSAPRSSSILTKPLENLSTCSYAISNPLAPP